MARVDKTESAVGVVRAALAADLAEATYDTVLGVSLDAQGRVVAGGSGGSGIIGVIVPSRKHAKAGDIADIFKLGDIVEIEDLSAGTKYYLDGDGALTDTATEGFVYAGYTVEADRLVLSGFSGVVAPASGA